MTLQVIIKQIEKNFHLRITSPQYWVVTVQLSFEDCSHLLKIILPSNFKIKNSKI